MTSCHADRERAGDMVISRYCFSSRMVCTRCGIVGADARPNWKEPSARLSLSGAQ